jgi:hypothetical protein
VLHILIFGTSLELIKGVKDFLSQKFEMKDLWEGDVILNIKLIKGENGGVTLSETHYVEKMLSRFGYSNSKPVPTPYDVSLVLRKNMRIMVHQLRYSRSLVH